LYSETIATWPVNRIV